MDHEQETYRDVTPNQDSPLSLVLGVLSIIFGVCGMLLPGLVLGIIGIVTAKRNDNLGKSGFVCSIIGTIISGFFVALIVLLLGFMVLPLTFLPVFFIW